MTQYSNKYFEIKLYNRCSIVDIDKYDDDDTNGIRKLGAHMTAAEASQIAWEIELDEGQWRLAAFWRGQEVAHRLVPYTCYSQDAARDIVTAATECVDELEYDWEQEALGKVPCDNCMCTGTVRGMYAINVCHYCDGVGWVKPYHCSYCQDTGTRDDGTWCGEHEDPSADDRDA